MPGPIDISDSQRKDYIRCPRRWAYNKVLKLKTGEDKWNLVFGNGVHTGLEHIHKGDTLQASVQAGYDEMQKDPDKADDMFELCGAMLTGYTTFFLPSFGKHWQTVTTEEWFEYNTDEAVRDRGKRDLKAALITDPDYLGIFDFKTTGSNGGGDLAKFVTRNIQLGQYCMSFYRKTGRWPNETGLIFLQKPRKAKGGGFTKAAIEKCRNDASLYYIKRLPVDQEFALFAIEWEKQVTLYGKQMKAIRDRVEQQGTAFLDFVPACFNNCVAYGSMCGYAKGCHSGKPAHTQITDLRRVK